MKLGQHHEHKNYFDIEIVIQNLENALADSETTKLAHYLDAFAELKKLFSHLGVVFSFVEADLHTKHGILSQLFAQDPHNYMTIERMVFYECFGRDKAESSRTQNNAFINHNEMELMQQQNSNVNSDCWKQDSTLSPEKTVNRNGLAYVKPKAAGSRTLLRLHRSLAFLLRFVELVRKPSSDSTSNLFRTAYSETLSRHHTWYIRASVQCACAMVPDRYQLIQIIFCTTTMANLHENQQKQKENEHSAAIYPDNHNDQKKQLHWSQEKVDELAERFLEVTRMAYERIEAFYARHGLLDLP